MRILVIGSGGREHALTWKLRQSPHADQIFCAPGNAGTGEIAENVAIPVSDLMALVRFAKENRVDLTVVGPDDPLAAGIVDLFTSEKLPWATTPAVHQFATVPKLEEYGTLAAEYAKSGARPG